MVFIWAPLRPAELPAALTDFLSCLRRERRLYKRPEGGQPRATGSAPSYHRTQPLTNNPLPQANSGRVTDDNQDLGTVSKRFLEKPRKTVETNGMSNLQPLALVTQTTPNSSTPVQSHMDVKAETPASLPPSTHLVCRAVSNSHTAF